MSTSLVTLPLVIWRNILLNWLGNLREIVRIDCACRFDASDNPLADVYFNSPMMHSSRSQKY